MMLDAHNALNDAQEEKAALEAKINELIRMFDLAMAPKDFKAHSITSVLL